jgi:flagellar hook-associated protein 1 FlgK
MSLNSLLEMSRRSFRSLDAAMKVAGQNVANLETEGYKRRRITLKADAQSPTGFWSRPAAGSFLGQGVSVKDFTRMRDALLMGSAWEARGGLGSAQEEHRIMSAIEGLFPTDGGSLFEQLEGFWNAWSDVANDPTDTGTRSALLGKTEGLAATLHQLDTDLQRLQGETRNTFQQGIGEVNGILEEIASLNVQIHHANSNGTPDFAAEDRRDLLVTELSDFAPVRVTESAQGYAISINGLTVVEGAKAMPLSIDNTGTPPRLLFGSNIEFQPPDEDGGKVSAWLRLLQDTIPEKRAALDELANALVTEVNNIHTTGFGLDNLNGRTFFDPAGTTAATIGLSADVASDPRAVAAGGATDAPGDSSIALDILALRTTTVLDGGNTTIDNFAIDLVTSVGAGAEAAAARAENHALVVDNLEAMERGVSAVSLDEEMTRLIELQQSYAATSRVLTTAQEMLDTLLNI